MCSSDLTHLLHCFPNFIPGIHAYGDTPDIAALIAPRPLLLNFGETDRGSPIAEVRTGIETIAAALSEPRDAIEEIVEPYLIQQGFVQRTPRGRLLTQAAFRHLGMPVPSGRPEQLGLGLDEEE